MVPGQSVISTGKNAIRFYLRIYKELIPGKLREGFLKTCKSTNCKYSTTLTNSVY